VHVSTVSVYGQAKDGPLDEKQICKPSGNAYGDSKLASENAMLSAFRRSNLPVTVLQPTIVYGPFAAWSIGPLLQFKQGCVALSDEGQGICNAVYIDDVVQALILACTSKGIEGERFLISGESPVTWGEYFEAYREITGGELTLMTQEELLRAMQQNTAKKGPIHRLINEFRSNAEFRRLFIELPGIKHVYSSINRMLPKQSFESVKSRVIGETGKVTSNPVEKQERPLVFPSPNLIPLISSKAHVKIDKAKRMLNYHPQFDFRKGMHITSQWAKWANLC
jgi:nucleoside-diphosphate-sugar epimerase